MESASAGTEILTVYHERNPRDRVPVAGMACDKRPAQVCESDPAQDLRIRSDITRVIVADELRLKDRQVNQQGDEAEPQTNKRRLPKPLRVKLPEDRFF